MLCSRIEIYDIEDGEEIARVTITDVACLMDALQTSSHPLLRKAAELLKKETPND
jgi:hypothetical protein